MTDPLRRPPAAPVVLFTGAGMSVDAGLPTYRGSGGLYEASGLEPPNASDVTPERLPALWARFAPRLRAAEKVGPSLAHRAAAELEEQVDGPVTVVTQNVDGLHQEAGSSRVVELHGSLGSVRCLGGGHRTPVDDVTWGDDGVPRCPQCGQMTRPDVVLFGESLPAAAWRAAERAIADAATIVAIGTSGQVWPAAGLIGSDRSAAEVRMWINPETEPPSPEWTWLRGSADAMVPDLLG